MTLSTPPHLHPHPQIYVAGSGEAEASEPLNLKLIPYGLRQDAQGLWVWEDNTLSLASNQNSSTCSDKRSK